MPAFSDIIDFLLGLLRDDAARAQFDRDPQKALADAGLQGVSAQDIRDARLQLADSGAVSAVDDGSHSPYPHGHDPVREIGYTTAHYAAGDDTAGHDSSTDTSPAASSLTSQRSWVRDVDEPNARLITASRVRAHLVVHSAILETIGSPSAGAQVGPGSGLTSG